MPRTTTAALDDFDDDGILRDGHSVRAPCTLMDSRFKVELRERYPAHAHVTVRRNRQARRQNGYATALVVKI